MKRWLLPCCAVVIAGCAHAPPRTPPAPVTAVPAAVPDAVPRIEPRSALGNPPFYVVGGHRYLVLASAEGYLERGVASWYGPDFHGGRTAMGERYDMYGMTAAHKTLPIPCYVRVTNLANQKSIVVRVNDRGPFVGNRIIDLSYTAALKLDMVRTGTAFVEVQTVPPPGADSALSAAAPKDVSALPTPTVASASAVDAPGPAAVAAQAAPQAAPQPPPQAAPQTASPGAAIAATPLFIQVGAYADGDNARRVAQRLRDAGLGQVFTLLPAAGQSLLRVRIGPVYNVNDFDLLMTRLVRLGFDHARLAQD